MWTYCGPETRQRIQRDALHHSPVAGCLLGGSSRDGDTRVESSSVVETRHGERSIRRVQGGISARLARPGAPCRALATQAGHGQSSPPNTDQVHASSGRGDRHGPPNPGSSEGLVGQLVPGAPYQTAVAGLSHVSGDARNNAVAMGGMPFVVLAESFARRVTIATRALTVSFPGALLAGRAREPQDSR